VIIGAQRAGTTSLYHHLVHHPQVRPPLRKEVQLLSVHWNRGLPWYHRHFPVARDPQLRTCEASPSYLFHPDAPVRAAAVLPDASNGFSRGFVAVIGTGRRESNGQVAG
jgi:hypothetical protein